MDSDPEEVKAHVRELHASDLHIDPDKMDELLFGIKCVEYEREIFGRRDGLYPDLETFARAKELHRFGNEQTWGPGPAGIWTSYNIARGIVKMLELTEEDTFYDLGSGYGRVPLYAGIVSAATCAGIELVEERAAITELSAQRLGLDNVSTKAGNIRGHDFSDGTAFYMYEPFRWATYEHVVNRLGQVANDHPIRIVMRIDNMLVRDNDRFENVLQQDISDAGVAGIKLHLYQSRA
jgi:histone methylation protein DOT1